MSYDLTPEDLREIRTAELNMSAKEFAKALGFSHDLIKSWESGRAIPSYDAQIKISDLAQIDFRVSAKRKHPLFLKKQSADIFNESRPEIRP